MNVSVSQIGWGNVGVQQTLEMMATLIDSGSDSPAVVNLARTLAVRGGVRNQGGQGLAIVDWLKRAWRFVSDPMNRELLLSPAVLLANYQQYGYVAGDCDEAAILGGALGQAVGFQVTLTVLAFPSGDGSPDLFQHVYASLLTDDGTEISLDITRPRGPLPTVTRRLTIAV